MPFEKGGRADKAGNRYEINCIINELLNLIKETNYSVVIEALGEDEKGTDILITNFAGDIEHQQCKARNASKEYWEITDFKVRDIFKNWKYQLNRDDTRQVALISPIGCSFLVDLHDRAVNSNGDPKDFYEIQVQKSSKDFCKFYQDFCTSMDLDYQKDNDILKSIDYLRRIKFKQMSEYVIKEFIYYKIDSCFSSDRNKVYNALVTFIIDGDILGKEITISTLLAYLETQQIEMRLMEGDKRIAPQIEIINQEYRTSFKPLQEGLIKRKEFENCIAAIENEQNLIISGNAGCGKSGCTEAILDYCDNEKIPHIAIKLDRKIPQRNCEMWGQMLGFPGSVSYALHSISQNEKAVIILDQLDALRWTQANSVEAISVCMELIRQVEYLNCERKHKIIIVFVCRTYDLHNDNNIKTLFKKESNINQEKTEWHKVVVQNLDEDTVNGILGEKYNKLTAKTRQLLQIPSNLYIWQHLDKEITYDDCTTTSNLIEKWYQQICKKSVSVGVNEKVVIETQKSIVDVLDRIGRLYVPKRILNAEEAGLDYLVSAEMVVVDENRVGYVHQSILDYFISKRMMQQYFEDTSIEEIVGKKNRQTPNKRYQIQMFLQNLLEFDSAVFIAAGKKMLESDEIRYYVKSVFYEILGQISHPDDNIEEFICESCKDNTKLDYLLNNVICGRHSYVKILREYGILEAWFADAKRKNVVFRLLSSISLKLDSHDIEFIKEHSFYSEADDKQFAGCFYHDITQESDEMFELRMMFYRRYPELAQELYIDMKSMMQNCEERTIKLISLWLNNKISSNGKNVYNYESELIDEDDLFSVQNGGYILDELLPYVPQDDSWEVHYSEWSGRFTYKRGLERAVVELIKKANKTIIGQNPDLFWKYYEPYMGKNYAIYNEIILHGLRYLPMEYSNQVISYLSADIDKNIFDYTSGTNEQLGLAKEVINIHAALCDNTNLISFENAVVAYVSPKACEWYKDRIEQNKTKEYAPVYWSFWGDLQYQLLQSIPYERLSDKSKSLLLVLDRKFSGKSYRYSNGDDHFGGVTSPVSGKRIGEKQWLQIITNKKLKTRRQSKWREVEGGFIESSLEMYSSDFSSAVKAEPEAMIQLVLKNKDEVIPFFIDSVYSGAEFSDKFNEVRQETWEELFQVFPCDMNNHRASYFCGIIEKSEIYTWSSDVLKQLKNIAINFMDETTGTDSEDMTAINCEKLHTKALNCVKGEAARAIGHLLWGNAELFSEFKEAIDILTLDDNPAVKMGSIYALWPSYNIDREWTEARILRLYEEDVRMVGIQDAKSMFFRLYPEYKERILTVIKRCFESEDKTLIRISGYSVCEFYIRHGEFVQDFTKVGQLNDEQVKAIVQMAILYLKYEEYRDKAKKIILICKNIEGDIGFVLSKIFHERLIDVERDSNFLLEIMKSKVSKNMVYSFVHFLEENACSIRNYAEIILTLCKNVLDMDVDAIAKQWGIENDISKLIIALYDECVNSERECDKQIAETCLELWDIMFEKQIGRIQELSRKLMER